MFDEWLLLHFLCLVIYANSAYEILDSPDFIEADHLKD